MIRILQAITFSFLFIGAVSQVKAESYLDHMPSLAEIKSVASKGNPSEIEKDSRMLSEAVYLSKLIGWLSPGAGITYTKEENSYRIIYSEVIISIKEKYRYKPELWSQVQRSTYGKGSDQFIFQSQQKYIPTKFHKTIKEVQDLREKEFAKSSARIQKRKMEAKAARDKAAADRAKIAKKINALPMNEKASVIPSILFGICIIIVIFFGGRAYFRTKRNRSPGKYQALAEWFVTSLLQVVITGLFGLALLAWVIWVAFR